MLKIAWSKSLESHLSFLYPVVLGIQTEQGFLVLLHNYSGRSCSKELSHLEFTVHQAGYCMTLDNVEAAKPQNLLYKSDVIH